MRESVLGGALTILVASATPSGSSISSTIRIGATAGERLLQCDELELRSLDA